MPYWRTLSFSSESEHDIALVMYIPGKGWIFIWKVWRVEEFRIILNCSVSALKILVFGSVVGTDVRWFSWLITLVMCRRRNLQPRKRSSEDKGTCRGNCWMGVCFSRLSKASWESNVGVEAAHALCGSILDGGLITKHTVKYTCTDHQTLFPQFFLPHERQTQHFQKYSIGHL